MCDYVLDLALDPVWGGEVGIWPRWGHCNIEFSLMCVSIGCGEILSSWVGSWWCVFGVFVAFGGSWSDFVDLCVGWVCWGVNVHDFACWSELGKS